MGSVDWSGVHLLGIRRAQGAPHRSRCMTTEPGGKLTRQARQFVWASQLGISTFLAFLRDGIGRAGWAFVLVLVVLLALLLL
jgi:hypothetical protein